MSLKNLAWFAFDLGRGRWQVLGTTLIGCLLQANEGRVFAVDLIRSLIKINKNVSDGILKN